MAILGTLLGLTVLVVTVIDVFLTILGGHNNGPVTERWTAATWNGLLAVHERRPIHRTLSIAGPAMVLVTVIVWNAGLIVGAGLVLVSHPGAVVDSTSGEPAAFMDVFYYTPVTLSGLGYGDFVPSGWPWTTFATLMTLTGAIVLTFALSYVISVSSAAVKRRAYAVTIFGLGETPAEIAPRLGIGDSRGSLHGLLASLATTLNEVAEQQVTFPVLRYFHAQRYKASAASATLVLADTVYLLEHRPEDQRLGEGLTRLLDDAIANFASSKHIRPADEGAGADHFAALKHEAETLRLGSSDGSDLLHGVDEYRERRVYLMAACRDDGWEPDLRS